jgi:hypothetical protein
MNPFQIRTNNGLNPDLFMPKSGPKPSVKLQMMLFQIQTKQGPPAAWVPAPMDQFALADFAVTVVLAWRQG